MYYAIVDGNNNIMEVFENATTAMERLDQYDDIAGECGIVELDDIPENATLIMSYHMSKYENT